jgi:hypothetical protein
VPAPETAAAAERVMTASKALESRWIDPPTEVRRLMSIADEPPAEAHPKIVQLIRHWQALAPAPGMLPGRQHFDPLRVHQLMPHLWLVDVVPDDPRRYRVRLVGGALVNARAPIRRGHFLSDAMTPEEARRSNELFGRIASLRHVDWRRGPSVLRHMDHVFALERVMMPMAADGVSVDMMLCMTLFYWTDGRIY